MRNWLPEEARSLPRRPTPGRDTALLGAGTVLQWNKSTSLFFNYIGEVGRANFVAHNFDGGFRYQF